MHVTNPHTNTIGRTLIAKRMVGLRQREGEAMRTWSAKASCGASWRGEEREHGSWR